MIFGFGEKEFWIVVGGLVIEVCKGQAGGLTLDDNEDVQPEFEVLRCELHDRENLAGHYPWDKNVTKEAKWRMLSDLMHEEDLNGKKKVHPLEVPVLEEDSLRGCKIVGLTRNQTTELGFIDVTLTLKLIYTKQEKINKKNPAKQQTGTKATETKAAAALERNKPAAVAMEKDGALAQLNDFLGMLKKKAGV